MGDADNPGRAVAAAARWEPAAGPGGGGVPGAAGGAGSGVRGAAAGGSRDRRGDGAR